MQAEIITISVIALCAGFYFLNKYKEQQKYVVSCESRLQKDSIEGIAEQLMNERLALDSLISKGTETRKKLKAVLSETSLKSEQIKMGLTPPAFSFDDSERLKSEIRECRLKQYHCIRRGDATDVAGKWTWFGDKAKGNEMVEDYRQLLTRAFNAEFESVRKKMRHNSYDIASEKLDRIEEQLGRLGETAGVYLSSNYITLKYDELAIWYDDLERKVDLKEERKAQQALIREQNKLGGDDTDELDEEISVRESELKKARQKAESLAGQERARLELLIEEIEAEKARLEAKYARAISQAQITKAGYIYVISNIGCFDEGIVKIGMTRRLEPMDRVNELGDASVAFKFDVHTLAFVQNAPSVERALHAKFTEARVNTDNLRKEFFRVSPEAVKEAMEEMGITSEWYLDAEARQYRESELMRSAISAQKLANKAPSLSLPDSI